MHLTYRSRGSEYHGLLQRRTISSGVYWTTVIFTHPPGWGPRCSRLLLREDRLPVPRALLAFFLVQGIEAGIGPSFGLDGVVLGPGLGHDGVVLLPCALGTSLVLDDFQETYARLDLVLRL